MDAYQEMIHTLQGCDEELPIHPILYVDTPSIAALKANLYYYELLKIQAFDAHKKAVIDAYEAMVALNNALIRKYHG